MWGGISVQEHIQHRRLPVDVCFSLCDLGYFRMSSMASMFDDVKSTNEKFKDP